MRAQALETARLVKDSAEFTFKTSVKEGRAKLTALRSRAESVKREYEMKVTIEMKARASAESAKARALLVQTQSSAEAALYQERLYEQAKAEALALKVRQEEIWAQVLSFYAEFKVYSANARKDLLTAWQSAEKRMMLAFNQVSGIQIDVVSKARLVVEDAQKQALILIKAQEAAD